MILICAVCCPAYSDVISDRMAVASPPIPGGWWSGLNTNGTPLSISALPNDWKEDALVPYSNKVNIRGQEGRAYTLTIQLNGDLIDSSTGKTIPSSHLKYIFTYAGGAFPGGIESDASGIRHNYRKYMNFSIGPQLVYESSTFDAAGEDQQTTEREFQFKYAIQVPDNQSPGYYTTTITYTAFDGKDTATRTNDLTVHVGELFTLSIDRGTVDFDKMVPGDTKDNMPPEGVVITSSTNGGNPWFLKISDDGPLSSGPFIISNSNFIWYGWTDGQGTWYGRGTNQLSLVPMLMYSSGPAETNNLPNGTLNHLKFKLSIPKGQPGGKYINYVRLTMTE